MSDTLEPKYECSICAKRYKRREHLFRHISSHTSQRPHQCTSCDGSFQRADVLKRHMRTCDGGNSRPSNRRRACDRCVRQKKACSAHQPCHSCAKKGAQCWYPTDTGSSSRSQASVEEETPRTEIESSMLGLASPANPMMPWGFTANELQNFGMSPPGTIFSSGSTNFNDWPGSPGLASERLSIFEPSISTEDSRQSLRFLGKFTSNTGLVSSFDCGTHAQREQLSAELDRHIAFQLQQRIMSLPALGMNVPSPTILEAISDTNSDEFPLDWFNDPLSLKTHEILLLIEEVVTIKPRNSSVTLDWSPGLKCACLQFFSPSNLRRFLGFYWAIWHPNVNFVHRPTFDPLAAKPTVLAAMALIGACVSPDMPENEDAKTWFNCVEEMVFIDDDFNSDMTYPPCGSMASQRRKIQALQAAYIVCLYQNWEGTDASKSRIRRDIGITSARHLNYSEQGRHDFEWKEYAAREELIRVFTWIYLLDSAFVIFNNLPPRMLVKEMRLHMTTPEACFQARTADQCHEQIQLFLPNTSLYWSISFRGAFESLCKDDPSTDIHHLLATLCPLNLFALTSGTFPCNTISAYLTSPAIHSQIFQLRSVVGSSQLLTPIRNALTNWRDIWQSFSSNFPQGIPPHMTIEDPHIQPADLWTRMGFCRYAPEYWLLAQLMADRLAVLGTSQQVNELEPLEEGPLDPILKKYDQTSMRQVNDLIMGFQTFQI
ncbi:unnamed protein product [Penicillium olsonii]|nr:unnamed protein product [Penicillium olsonii]